MAITWLTPSAIAMGNTVNTWIDMDVSASVPAGATGVVLHVRGAASSVRTFGVRKKGSTDDRTGLIQSNYSNAWTIVGVDNDRVFQITRNANDTYLYLVGYTTDETSIFENSLEKVLGSAATWTDIDISADTGSNKAIGVIVEIKNTTSSSGNWGIRKKGSTDEYYYLIIENGITWAFIGVDDNEVLELKVADVGIKAYVIGYFTKDVVFNTNGTDISLTQTGGYYDLPALPSGATGGFIQVCGPTQTRSYAIRKNGTTQEFYGYVTRMAWAAVECDEDGLLEGRISNTAGRFYLSGYTLGSADPSADPTGIFFAAII